MVLAQIFVFGDGLSVNPEANWWQVRARDGASCVVGDCFGHVDGPCPVDPATSAPSASSSSCLVDEDGSMQVLDNGLVGHPIRVLQSTGYIPPASRTPDTGGQDAHRIVIPLLLSARAVRETARHVFTQRFEVRMELDSVAYRQELVVNVSVSAAAAVSRCTYLKVDEPPPSPPLPPPSPPLPPPQQASPELLRPPPQAPPPIDVGSGDAIDDPASGGDTEGARRQLMPVELGEEGVWEGRWEEGWWEEGRWEDGRWEEGRWEEPPRSVGTARLLREASPAPPPAERYLTWRENGVDVQLPIVDTLYVKTGSYDPLEPQAAGATFQFVMRDIDGLPVVSETMRGESQGFYPRIEDFQVELHAEPRTQNPKPKTQNPEPNPNPNPNPKFEEFQVELHRVDAPFFTKREQLRATFLGNKQRQADGTLRARRGGERTARELDGRVEVVVELSYAGPHFVIIRGTEGTARDRLMPWAISVMGFCPYKGSIVNAAGACECPAGMTRETRDEDCTICPAGYIKSEAGDGPGAPCETCPVVHTRELFEVEPNRRITRGPLVEDHDSLADCGCAPGYFLQYTSLKAKDVTARCPKGSNEAAWRKHAHVLRFAATCCLNSQCSGSADWVCVEQACRDEYLEELLVVEEDPLAPAECLACDEQKHNCNRSLLTTRTVPIKPGYWRPNELSVELLPCTPSLACTGVYHFASPTSLCRPPCNLPWNHTESLCRPGHSGPFCSVCVDRFFKSNADDMCYPCDVTDGQALTWELLAYLGPSVVMLVLLVLTCVCLIRSKLIKILLVYFPDTRDKFNSAKDFLRANQDLFIRIIYAIIFPKVKVIISMLQIQVGVIPVFSINFPLVYKNVLRQMTFWDGALELPVDCVNWLRFNFAHRLLWRCSLPFFVSIPALCLIYFEKLSPKKVNLLSDAIFMMIFLLYPGVTTIIFEAFRCRDFEDGSQYLDADLSIDCQTELYDFITLLAAAMVLVVTFGVPFLYYIVIQLHEPQLSCSARVQRAMKTSRGVMVHGAKPSPKDDMKAEAARQERAKLRAELRQSRLHWRMQLHYLRALVAMLHSDVHSDAHSDVHSDAHSDAHSEGVAAEAPFWVRQLTALRRGAGSAGGAKQQAEAAVTKLLRQVDAEVKVIFRRPLRERFVEFLRACMSPASQSADESAEQSLLRVQTQRELVLLDDYESASTSTLREALRGLKLSREARLELRLLLSAACHTLERRVSHADASMSEIEGKEDSTDEALRRLEEVLGRSYKPTSFFQKRVHIGVLDDALIAGDSQRSIRSQAQFKVRSWHPYLGIELDAGKATCTILRVWGCQWRHPWLSVVEEERAFLEYVAEQTAQKNVWRAAGQRKMLWKAMATCKRQDGQLLAFTKQDAAERRQIVITKSQSADLTIHVDGTIIPVLWERAHTRPSRPVCGVLTDVEEHLGGLVTVTDSRGDTVSFENPVRADGAPLIQATGQWFKQWDWQHWGITPDEEVLEQATPASRIRRATFVRQTADGGTQLLSPDEQDRNAEEDLEQYVAQWSAIPMEARRADSLIGRQKTKAHWLSEDQYEWPEEGDELLAIDGELVPRGTMSEGDSWAHTETYAMLHQVGTRRQAGGSSFETKGQLRWPRLRYAALAGQVLCTLLGGLVLSLGWISPFWIKERWGQICLLSIVMFGFFGCTRAHVSLLQAKIHVGEEEGATARVVGDHLLRRIVQEWMKAMAPVEPRLATLERTESVRALKSALVEYRLARKVLEEGRQGIAGGSSSLLSSTPGGSATLVMERASYDRARHRLAMFVHQLGDRVAFTKADIGATIVAIRGDVVSVGEHARHVYWGERDFFEPPWEGAVVIVDVAEQFGGFVKVRDGRRKHFLFDNPLTAFRCGHLCAQLGLDLPRVDEVTLWLRSHRSGRNKMVKLHKGVVGGFLHGAKARPLDIAGIDGFPAYILTLTNKYDLRYRFWEVAECVRKLLFVGGFSAVQPDTTVQLVVGMAVSMIFLVACMHACMYKMCMPDNMTTWPCPCTACMHACVHACVAVCTHSLHRRMCPNGAPSPSCPPTHTLRCLSPGPSCFLDPCAACARPRIRPGARPSRPPAGGLVCYGQTSTFGRMQRARTTCSPSCASSRSSFHC